jgi:hypothetical protein
MLITESIQKAIQAAIRKSGSSLSFSRSIGVSHTTVSYWLNGRTRKINSTVWQNLLPLIQEHLNAGESIRYPYDPVAGSNPGCIMREPSAAWYAAGSAPRSSVPLLLLRDLEDFDPQIDPLEELVREKSAQFVSFTSFVQPGYFAVEIDKKRSGFFPVGTRLLLRGQDAPGDGDTVLVKFREKKEFLFAVYRRRGDEVTLTPLRESGRKRVIPRGDFHNVVCWIAPIREAVQLF